VLFFIKQPRDDTRLPLNQGRVGLYLSYCKVQGPSWSASYGSLIYDYLCSQCLSPQTLWVRILLRRDVIDTILCDKVCQWLAAGRWFSSGTPVSSINQTDRHDITIILLKVASNVIPPIPHYFLKWSSRFYLQHC